MPHPSKCHFNFLSCDAVAASIDPDQPRLAPRIWGGARAPRDIGNFVAEIQHGRSRHPFACYRINEHGRNVAVPAIEGLFLFYHGHRQVPTALRAFIDMVRAPESITAGRRSRVPSEP